MSNLVRWATPLPRKVAKAKPSRSIPGFEIPRTIPGLVLWRRMDDQTGALVTDISGHGSHTDQGVAGEQATNVDADLDGHDALDFDGTADNLILGNAGDILAATNGAASVLYWAVLKVDDATAAIKSLLSLSTGAASNSLRFKAGARNPAGTAIWAVGMRAIDGGAGANLESTTAVDANPHILMFEADYGNGDARIWLDNTLIAENTAILTPGNVSATNSLSGRTGTSPSGGAEFWPGRLYEDGLHVLGTGRVSDTDRDLLYDYLVSSPRFPSLLSGDATVTPATIAATVSVPQPGVGVGAAPATAAATAAVPQAAVGVGAAPAALAAVAALPDAAVSVGVVPATLAATVSVWLPAAVGQIGDANVFPATIAALVTLPQATVSVGAAPATILTIADVTMGLGVDVGVAPASFTVPVTLPQPGVGVGATPATLAALTAMAKANIGVGVAPATIVASIALPDVDVGVGIAPASFASTVAVWLPAQVGEVGGGGVTVTPATLAALAALPQAAVSVGVAPAVVALAAALPLATVAVHALAQPATAALVVGLPQPAVSVGVAPAAIALVVAVLAPERVGPPFEANINPAGPVIVGIIAVEADTLVGATSRPGGMPGGIG